MRVFIISPQLTMKNTFYADEFNKEIMKAIIMRQSMRLEE